MSRLVFLICLSGSAGTRTYVHTCGKALPHANTRPSWSGRHTCARHVSPLQEKRINYKLRICMGLWTSMACMKTPKHRKGWWNDQLFIDFLMTWVIFLRWPHVLPFILSTMLRGQSGLEHRSGTRECWQECGKITTDQVTDLQLITGRSLSEEDLAHVEHHPSDQNSFKWRCSESAFLTNLSGRTYFFSPEFVFCFYSNAP